MLGFNPTWQGRRGLGDTEFVPAQINQPMALSLCHLLSADRWLGGVLQGGGVGLEESETVVSERIKVGLGRSRSERLGIASLGLSGCVFQSRTCPARMRTQSDLSID